MAEDLEFQWDFEIPNLKSFDSKWSLQSTGRFIDEYPSVFTLDEEGLCIESSIEINSGSSSFICQLMSGRSAIGVVAIFTYGPYLDGNEEVIDKFVESDKDVRLPLGQLVNDANTKHMKVLGDINAISGVVFGSPATSWGVEPTDEETVVEIKGDLTVLGYSSHANVAKNPDVIVFLNKEFAIPAEVDKGEKLASQDFEVAETIAMCDGAPASLLSAIARNADEEIRASVARNTGCSPEILSKLALDSDAGVRVAVAGNPNCSMATLQVLASDSDDSVRKFVAGNPSTDPNLLLSLSLEFPEWVASNPSVPNTFLEEVSESKAVAIVKALAKNPKASRAILKSLVTSKSVDVRRNLADNPSTPAETVALLAADKNKDVRKDIALRVSAPGSILETLATDKSSEVKWAVAGNPSTPSKTLAKMASKGNKDPYMLGCNPSTPVDVLTKFSENLDNASNLSQNPGTPAEILVQLADDSQNHSLLAFNPSTPEEVRRKVILSKLNSAELGGYHQRDLASCKFLSSEDFYALMVGNDAYVYTHIAVNPAAPSEIVRIAEDRLEAMLLGKPVPKDS
jgi:hypothetical protein